MASLCQKSVRAFLMQPGNMVYRPVWSALALAETRMFGSSLQSRFRLPMPASWAVCCRLKRWQDAMN